MRGMAASTPKTEGENRSVYFAAGELDKLDTLCAEAGGVSRSTFIRDMIDKRWTARERRLSKA